jgi:C4-type Zn-finger protein
MKTKEYFLREDLATYKPKFKMLCDVCEFKLEKFESYVKKPYICRIIITDKVCQNKK